VLGCSWKRSKFFPNDYRESLGGGPRFGIRADYRRFSPLPHTLRIEALVRNQLLSRRDPSLSLRVAQWWEVVKAVSLIRDVGIATVSGTGMMGAPGVAAKVFQTLGSNNVNVMMTSQGSFKATISCVVANREVDRAVRALQLALMGQGYVWIG